MPSVLVAGDESWRRRLAGRFDEIDLGPVDDADPELGDVVMFIRHERERYDVVVFVGYDDPVTRGALAVVAERAILVPLVLSAAQIDGRHDGYLFRLPRALAFRDENERAAVHDAVPRAVGVPGELVGRDLADDEAWRRLLRGQ